MNLRAADLETPCALVDLDRLAANITKLQTYLSGHGIANRPHIKTHKVPEIARMQLAAGAVGICCQKLGEAEVFADAQFSDIFLPYNILGATKLARLIALARRVRIAVTADSIEVVTGLSQAAAAAALTVTAWVEFDTGLGRCGVQSPAAAADLAAKITSSPGLAFGGLMTHPHNDQTDQFVAQAHALLAQAGIAPGGVSLGSTEHMGKAHARRGVTEYRAGMYVYGDRSTILNGAMTRAECAFRVATTVVSRPTADRGILDAGSKVLSSDLLGLTGHGLIEEYPEAVIRAVSEEHGHVDFSGCARRPRIGDRVHVIPNHCCPVSNLLDTVYGVRDGKVEDAWRVAARGKVQ